VHGGGCGADVSSHGFRGKRHAARQASCDRPLVRGWLPGRRLAVPFPSRTSQANLKAHWQVGRCGLCGEVLGDHRVVGRTTLLYDADVQTARIAVSGGQTGDILCSLSGHACDTPRLDSAVCSPARSLMPQAESRDAVERRGGRSSAGVSGPLFWPSSCLGWCVICAVQIATLSFFFFF
jgi:hypothetical protein